MSRVFQIVKKVTAAAFGSASTTVTLRPAPSLGQVVNGTAKVAIAEGVGLDTSRSTLLTTVAPALGVTTSASGSAVPTVNKGVAIGTSMSLQPVPVVKGVSQVIRVDLAGQYGAAACTATNVSGTIWATPANAAGVHNGTLASHPGAVTAQHSFLTFTYPTFPNKDSLTVTAVKLRYYARQAGTVAANGLMRFTHGSVASPSNGGALQPLPDQTGNVDYLTAPYEVDLYALGFTTFASLAGFQAVVRGILAAGAATVTQDVDAVELIITANA